MNETRLYRAIGKYGPFSNLFRRKILFEDREFDHSEAACQFGKPKDTVVAEWIISAPKPHLVADAAHSLLVFDIRADWNKIKVDRMRAVLFAKFTQHEDLKQLLLRTGDATLIEGSKTDAFWGAGKKGNGKNMLGLLLMETREKIIKMEEAKDD